MELRGVIDLGSNSIRLVVYEIRSHHARKNEPKSNLFHDILDEKTIAGLSAYVKKGVFTEDGIDSAVSVLEDHLDAAENIGCSKVSIFATAVIRNCSNSKAVVKAIDSRIGKRIDVLSAEEEAHLGFIGATCDSAIETGTLIDIGGGSTELTIIKSGSDKVDVSIPQGCVSSYSEFVEMILPKQEEIKAIEDAFREKMESIPDISDFNATNMYGIGGSVRAIDKLYAKAFSNEARLRTLERYQIDALFTLFNEHPSTFAHLVTKAVPDRIHTVVPGMTIAKLLMDTFGSSDLSICKYGVREGYLLEKVLEA